LVIRSGIGTNRTISMSNTMKITASRKNRMENGIRADRTGSNPHSNGESFSRLLIDERIAVNIEIVNTSGGINNANIVDSVTKFID
jgi:hypothetical protein